MRKLCVFVCVYVHFVLPLVESNLLNIANSYTLDSEWVEVRYSKNLSYFVRHGYGWVRYGLTLISVSVAVVGGRGGSQ